MVKKKTKLNEFEIMKKIFFNILIGLGLLSLMACSDEAPENTTNKVEDNAITFSLYTEPDATATRSSYTGSASHINQLVYRIYKWEYDEDKKESVYKLDEYFLKNDTYTATKYKEDGTIERPVTLTSCGVINNKPTPYYIRLVPNPKDDPNQKYKIVCWAQKKDSPFFDLTEFPEKISMNYSAIANNDETMDAFYGSTEFTASTKTVNINLIRPFAQINIGTPGWDYEGFASIQPNGKIIKSSKIDINGVAKSFSPWDGKAEAGQNNENLTNVTYDWNKIPAYSNLASLKNITGVCKYDPKTGIYTNDINEEFLYLDLPDPQNSEQKGDDINDIEGANKKFKEHQGYDNRYAAYIGWKEYDNLCKDNVGDALINKIFTETFKYLSMCYVLVPFEEENGLIKKGSTVNVSFDCAVEVAEDGNPTYKSVLGENKKVFDVSNVPVKCNTRTNIIATDGTGFFMNTKEIKVKIYTQTFADYYKHHHAIDKEWDRKDESDYDEEDPDYHGESDDKNNDDYEWPKDDFDPELGKRTADRPEIIVPDNGFYKPNDYVIPVFRYVDNNNDFIIDEELHAKELTFIIGELRSEDLIFNTNQYNYTFDLEGVDNTDNQYFTATPVSNGSYKVTINTDKLIEIIKTKNISKVRNVSGEALQINYYPLYFHVNITLDDQNYRAPESVVTIKVFPLYQQYTFSKTSQDDGGKIWNLFTTKGTKATGSSTGDKAASDEVGYYYLENLKYVETNNIKVVSRKGTTGNNMLVALDNRLRFKGAGFFPGETNEGHYIVLKNMSGKFRIIFKLGRDVNMDNSQANKDTGVLAYYDRNVILKYDDQNHIIDTWNAYRLPSDKVTPNVSTKGISNKYLHNETYITKAIEGKDPDLSREQDVMIKIDNSGTCVYWIMVSPLD